MEYSATLKAFEAALTDLETKRTAHTDASAATTATVQQARAVHDAAVQKAQDALNRVLTTAAGATTETATALSAAIDTAQRLRRLLDEQLAGLLPATDGRVRQG